MLKKVIIKFLLYFILPCAIGFAFRTNIYLFINLILLYAITIFIINLDNRKWKFRWINEYKKRDNYDIHITPVITFNQTTINNELGSGVSHAIALEWLCFAVAIMRYKVKPI